MYVDPDTRIATYVNPVYGIAPTGWELRQTETGRLFYVNRQNGSMTWHKPLAVEQLPAGWEAGKTADGKVFVHRVLPSFLKAYVLIRYYINHVTRSNTWVKPTLPADATVPVTLTSRPSVPAPPPIAPTLSQVNHHQLQNSQSQVSPRSSFMPTNQKIALPNQPGSYMSQPARAQDAMSPTPRMEYRTTQAMASPQSQSLAQTQLPYRTQQSSPTSTPFAAAPPQNWVATTNRPGSASTVPQQPQTLLPPSPGLSTTSPSRPALQSRIVSAPAATQASSAASSMGSKFKGSMTVLKQNPGWKKAALGVGALGTMAVKAALMDDYGSGGDSADFATEDSTAAVGGDTLSSPPAYEQQSGGYGAGYDSHNTDSSGQVFTDVGAASAFPTQPDSMTLQQDQAALQAQMMLQEEGQLNAVGLI